MPKYVTQEHFDTTIETLVTKDEFNSFRNDVTARFDEVITILKRLDQERVFTIEWIRRIESDVNRIKGQLKIV